MKNLPTQQTLRATPGFPLYVVHLNPEISKPQRPAIIKQLSCRNAFLQKVEELIHENIDESEFGIAHLCEAMHLSYMQIFRKIKTLTGASPTTFIRKVRLKKAKELLLTTDLNISEIAYDMGFTDPNYFSRVFSKEFKMAPSAMRNRSIN